jgi:hypothetical protein
MFHVNIKHIEVHYHFVKENIIFGKFNLEHVATKNELTNIVATLLWPSVGVKPNTWKK